MLGASRRHRIGKGQNPIIVPGHVLDLKPKRAVIVFSQGKIEARAFGINDFAANIGHIGHIAGQCWYPVLDQGLVRQFIRVCRIEANQMIRLPDDLQTVGQFALGIVGLGQPDFGILDGETGQTAGIGTVGGDDLAGIEPNVRQKTLIALDQSARMEWLGQAHRFFSFQFGLLMSTVSAALLIIGNEILSGRTVDANLPHLAVKLNEAGVRLAEARVVPDIEDEIVQAVRALAAKHDYVFTTGGIGPTHDDITAASIAKAFDRPFERNTEAAAILEAFYGDRVNEARMSMADMPQGARLIDNPVSRAPGFAIENVFVMAGVPKIMQAMLDNIVPELKGGATVHSRTVTVYKPESELAPTMAELENAHAGLEVGSYPFMQLGNPGTAVVLRHIDTDMLQQAQQTLLAILDGMNAAYE